MSRRAVVAVGGSVLSRVGQRGTHEEQLANARSLAGVLSKFVSSQHKLHGSDASAKYSTVLVHGNGPQVGNIQRQQESLSAQIPPFPLDCAVAMTQGSMGYLIENCLSNQLRKEKHEIPIASLVTQVLIDKSDPALAHATKAVGRYYPRETALQLQRDLRWAMMEEVGKGWRQVVPSPRPLTVVQASTVKLLADNGYFVIAGGGGGIPVMKSKADDALLTGADAVVDKDFTAAVLADEIDAELFVLMTNVDKVCLHYGLPHEEPLNKVSLKEVEKHFNDGHFLPGTMGSKIEAAMFFLSKNPKRQVLFATPHAIATGNPETIGTRITGH